MSTTATFPQAKHLLEIFETLESGQLQALFASGLLIDLRRCAAELDPTTINRDEFQKVLGLAPPVFKVKMGGSNNTDQIMSALGFSFDERITQANFPLQPSETPMEDQVTIIDPGCSFSEEEGLQILKDKGLKRPTYEHAIRFAEQHGKTTASGKKPFIIFLHKAWRDPDRNHRVVCLNRSARYPRLDLSYPDFTFDDLSVLAGVRPRK